MIEPDFLAQIVETMFHCKESFHRVYQAFETLADAERRQSYDIRLCSSEDSVLVACFADGHCWIAEGFWPQIHCSLVF